MGGKNSGRGRFLDKSPQKKSADEVGLKEDFLGDGSKNVEAIFADYRIVLFCWSLRVPYASITILSFPIQLCMFDPIYFLHPQQKV